MVLAVAVFVVVVLDVVVAVSKSIEKNEPCLHHAPYGMKRYKGC